MKKGIVLGVLSAILSTTMVLAYAYSASIAVTESSSNSYTQLAIIADVDNQYLADNGYIDSTGLDTKVLLASTELPHMLADDKTLFSSAVSADTSYNFTYTLGEDTSLSSMPIMTGYNGYVTITDDPKMEAANIFNFDLTGYIDTLAGIGKNLLYKKESFIVYVNDDLSIRASILGAATWVDPTSFSDPDTAWQNEANVYDNNLATFSDTTATVATTSWSSYIHITRATTNIEEIRFMANMVIGQIDQVDLDIWYNATWYNLYQGTYLDDVVGTVWNEYDIIGIADNVNQIRFRFYNSDAATARTPQLIEVDYGEAAVSKSVTATSTTVGEHRIMVDADNTDFEIFVDDMVTPKDTIAQAGASVPDTANNWILMGGNSVPYASRIAYTNESTIYSLGEFTGQIDTLEFASVVHGPHWLKVPGINYGVVASYNTDDGQLRTFTLTTGGAIGGAVVDTAVFAAGASGSADLELISLDNSAYFAVVYPDWDDSSNGWMKTFSINATGGISAMIDSLEFDATGSVWGVTIRHLSGTQYAIAYAFATGGDYDAKIVTVNIDNDGTNLAVTDGPSVIDTLGPPSGENVRLENVSGTTYVLAYRQGTTDDAIMKTITIEDNGSIGNVIDTRTIVGYGNGVAMVGGLNDNLFIVKFHDASNYTYLNSLTISDAGVISTVIDTLIDIDILGSELFHTIENSFLLTAGGYIYSYSADEAGVISEIDDLLFGVITPYYPKLMEIDSSGVYGVAWMMGSYDGHVASFGVELLSGALLYQPITIINGNTLPDRIAVPQNGVITWGSNPTGIAVSVGGLESTTETGDVIVDEPVSPGYVAVTPAEDLFTETTGENIPIFYPIFKFASDTTGWPIQIFWIAGALSIAMLFGALTMMYLRSMMLAGLVSAVLVAAFASMEIIPWWTLYVYLFMAIAFIIYQKVQSV